MNINAILNNQPEIFNVEAITSCSIRRINYEDFDKLLKEITPLEHFTRYLLMNAVQNYASKLMSMQFHSAEERYENMITQYPDILLNVPLGYIASYLGITQSTLSVIRGNFS